MSIKTTSKELTNAIVLFAGDSGDGMQLTGTQFTNTVARLGNDLSTLPDFPAEIRAPLGTVAGVSGYQIQFGSVEINSPGDHCDVLVAMNAAAIKKCLPQLDANGLIIVDTSGFDSKNLRLAGYEISPLEALKSKYKVYEIDITKQTQIALADFHLSGKEKDRCKNMFALGFIYWLYSKPLDFSLDFLVSKFGKETELYKANQEVLKVGFNYGEIVDIFTERFVVSKSKMPAGTYRNISGNEAVSLGLVAASKKSGIEIFFGGYPITPASDILHNLVKYKHFGVKTFQAEDEIAAITSAIGASWAGNIGVTASSGPGISLKTEAMGLALMLELPLLIINVQRGGPSTGLPTKTEQSDLLQAVYGRNGEAPIPVFAAKTPSDCFSMAFFAVKTAVEFATPVILLTDGYLANGSEPWKFPQESDLENITYPLVAESEKNHYKPYLRDENFVRDLALPGMAGFEHRVGGLEKQDITGNISYDGENHQIMTENRQAKFDKIATTYPKSELDQGEIGAEKLVISWGSTYGSIKSTVKRLILENQSIAHLHLQYINPLPLDLETIIKSSKKVIIPELNNGQLIKIIRDKFLVDAKGIHKIKGQPFTTEELYEKIRQM